MRIAYVEDNLTLLKTVSHGLRKAGYVVDCAGDGEEGLWLVHSHDYDAVILDIMLPKLDGLDLLKRIRSEGNKVHVLLLTAKDTIAERVEGLRIGADDYLTKPFSFDELLARVEALVRRAYDAKSPILRIGGLEIDRTLREVRYGGKNIQLPRREYALLEYLALRAGQVVSRTEIEEHIYDDKVSPMSNVVDAAVYALRQKIDARHGRSLIRTRRGHGYILVSDAETS